MTTPPRSTADAAAPLHERLEALATFIASETRDRRDRFGIWPAEEDASLIREAAAELRPPEGEVGKVIAVTEGVAAYLRDQKAFAQEAFIRAALAHLRRLAAVEAERDQMSRAIWWVLQSDGDIVFTDEEIAEFGEPAAIECVRDDGDTLTVIRAIAPAPAAEGEA